MQPPSTTTSSSTTGPETKTPSTQPPQKTITITLKPLRPTPSLPPSFPATPLSTSIYALKERIAADLPGKTTTAEDIKLLYARKPASDAKTVAEVVGAGEDDVLAGGKGEEGEMEVEFGVMVMGGGGGAGTGGEGREGEGEGGGGGGISVAQGVSGEEVLSGDAFWDDLRGWLMQRVRDEAVAGEAWGVFKRGWDDR